MKKIGSFIILSIIFIAGCEKSPVKDLLFPKVNDAKTWNNEWILYGGVDGIFGEDVRTNDWDPVKPLTDYWEKRRDDWDMNYTKEHHTGITCIMMKWDGSVSNAYNPAFPAHVNYVGFYLQSKLESRDPSVVGIDISDGKYNYLKFWVKGHLTSGVTFKVTSDACGGEVEAQKYYDLTDSWQLKQIHITTPKGADPARKVVNMISFVLEATTVTNGGEVYIDDVRYTR
ncbi:MAG: hypothetical protein LBD17_06580 [Endomicrobium sp.]|jgi:hypothetical protein|nr:hypothetical protein [Endomicrobium sp.]